jgi:transposase
LGNAFSTNKENKSNSCRWLVNGVVYETLLEAATKFGVTKQTIIKWVDGWTDKRRNKTWSAKDGCKRLPKY